MFKIKNSDVLVFNINIYGRNSWKCCINIWLGLDNLLIWIQVDTFRICLLIIIYTFDKCICYVCIFSKDFKLKCTIYAILKYILHIDNIVTWHHSVNLHSTCTSLLFNWFWLIGWYVSWILRRTDTDKVIWRFFSFYWWRKTSGTPSCIISDWVEPPPSFRRLAGWHKEWPSFLLYASYWSSIK